MDSVLYLKVKNVSVIGWNKAARFKKVEKAALDRQTERTVYEACLSPADFTNM